MANLKTPAEVMNLLHDNGYQLNSTCTCGGIWWEKFRNEKSGVKIHVAPYKNRFTTKNATKNLGGNLEELKSVIETIK